MNFEQGARQRRSRAVLLPLLLTLALYGQAASAQHEAGAERPRVGLVLGGGGARGAAHIGVLKELERLRIPIDAIVGTSMGAAVGGLYATGMSADELEILVGSIDWVTSLSDRSARRNLSFRRKQDDRQYPFGLELGLDRGRLKLPRGAIQGHNLDLLLRELLLEASYIDDFDALPIPFRAIASDIGAGEKYVMGKGDLAEAVRASMSVPGVFAPVRIDGRLLSDGGLVGNLGVSVMRELGVDVIIAVDVEFPLYSEDELVSALSVSEQMLTILIRQETLRQIDLLGEDDILLRPDLGEFGSADFVNASGAVEPGVAAARSAESRLRKLGVSDEAYAAWRASRLELDPLETRLSFVRVESDSRIDSRIIESRLRTQPGDPIDRAALLDDAQRMHGLEVFERVGYRLVDENGERGVIFNARKKPWGPAYLRTGLTLSDDVDGSSAFNLAARVTRPALNRLGGEWRTDLQLGSELLFASELHQPLRFDSRVFLTAGIAAGRSEFNVFEGGDNLANIDVWRAEASFGGGIELGNTTDIRLSAYRGLGESQRRVGAPSVAEFEFDTGGLRSTLRIDSQDDAQFPRHGLLARASYDVALPAMGADVRADFFELDWSAAFSRGKNTLNLGGSYRTTARDSRRVEDFYPLGGFLNLSGLSFGQRAGPHLAVLRAFYYRRVGNSAGGLFTVPLYLGASLEAGNVWSERRSISLDSALLHGSLFAGLDTFVGPFYLALGFGEGGERNVYIFLGSPPRRLGRSAP
ncbi:MAG: patatin-like phospholipase family protein [Pseudomonadota bacterium]